MIAALLLQAAVPVPGTVRTIADWVVGCDNARACQANALAATGADPAALMLVVQREAGAAAPARLELPVPSGQPRGARLTLAIDGQAAATIVAPGGSYRLTLPLEGDLLARLAAGRTATLAGADGRILARASLAGFATALAAIDTAQGRAGTVTALRRPGRRLARTVPIAPALPVVTQPAIDPRPPRTLSPKDARRLIARDMPACANARPAPRAFRLDAAHSLVTIDLPCAGGGYNGVTAVFVVDEKGRAAPAAIDAPPDAGNRIVTGGWDAATRRLTSFVRGRETGDCGTDRAYAWNGARFALVQQKDMPACRGSTDYIVTWRAQVVAE